MLLRDVMLSTDVKTGETTTVGTVSYPKFKHVLNNSVGARIQFGQSEYNQFIYMHS